MANRVFLIGMACSGKTTVGRMLAIKMGWNFFDTDQYIIEKYKVDIRHLINTDKNRFYDLEYEALVASEIKGRCIISTGGRTYLSDKNKKYMSRYGSVIFIKVSVLNLLKRFNESEQKKRALPLRRLPIWLALPVVYWMRMRKYMSGSRAVDGNKDPVTVADDVMFLVNK